MVAILLDSPYKLTQGLLEWQTQMREMNPTPRLREALAQNLFLPPTQMRDMIHLQKNQKCTVLQAAQEFNSWESGREELGWF